MIAGDQAPPSQSLSALVGIYGINTSLFITLFIITLFWIEHGLVKDQKYIDYVVK